MSPLTAVLRRTVFLEAPRPGSCLHLSLSAQRVALRMKAGSVTLPSLAHWELKDAVRP